MDKREIEQDILTTNNYLANVVKKLPFENPELMDLMFKYGPLEFMVMVMIGMFNGIRNFALQAQVSKIELMKMFIMYCEIDMLTYTQVGMELMKAEKEVEDEHVHNCDECEHAGQCPLEGDIRAMKAAQKAAGGISDSDEDKDEGNRENVVQLRRSRLN